MSRTDWLDADDERVARALARKNVVQCRGRLLAGLLAELDERRARQATGGPEPPNQNPGQWDNVGGSEGPAADETIPADELARRAAWNRGYRPAST